MDIKDVWRYDSYCKSHPAPKCRPIFYQTSIDWAIHFHIGRNWEVIPTFLEIWNRFPKKHKPDVWFTYHDDQPIELLQAEKQKLNNYEKFVNHIYWKCVPNKGADIFPFLLVIDQAIKEKKEYITILKLHAKKSSDEWLRVMLNDLTSSTEWIEWFLDCHLIRNDIGMIVPLCDTLDYINFPMLMQLLTRSGIFPKPYYEKYKSFQEIHKEYEQDSKHIKVSFPPPSNQFRKNNLLMDAHIAWHYQRNPLGMSNFNHHTFMFLQEKPYHTGMTQQIYTTSGSMFWMNFNVCKQLNERFPIHVIENEFEETIIKDNLWNKKTHAWERFFGAYTSLQGYTIMDIKYKVNFRKLPENLILYNFIDYEKNKNVKMSQLPTFFPIKQEELKKQTSYNLPLFTKPQELIPNGFASGIQNWFPIFIKPTSKKTIKQWIYDNLIQDNLTWKHIWFQDIKELSKWLHTSSSTTDPITIWIPQSISQKVIQQIEIFPEIHKFSKINIEIMDSTYSFIYILDMLHQTGKQYPTNWNIQFINFPYIHPQIKQEDTLSNILTISNNLSVNIPFWGNSLIPLLKNDFLINDNIITMKQINEVQNTKIIQNKIGIEITNVFSTLNNTHTKLLSQLTQLFQSSSTDFNQNQPFQILHKYNTMSLFTNYPENVDLLPLIKWFQQADLKQLQFYPYHQFTEKIFNLYTSRNAPFNKFVNKSWHSTIRTLTNHKVEYSLSANNNIQPSKGFLWHAQIINVPQNSNDYFIRNGSFPINQLILEKFMILPQNMNYLVAVFRFNSIQEETYLIIYLYNNTKLHQIWMKTVINQLDPNLLTRVFLNL